MELEGPMGGCGALEGSGWTYGAVCGGYDALGVRGGVMGPYRGAMGLCRGHGWGCEAV